MKNKYLIIAGEASGDMHGARLINEIKRINPDSVFFGIGGDLMLKEGLQLKYHIKDLAFLGFIEIIKHLPFFSKVKKDLITLIKTENIENIIFVDYPGFNLNFAKKINNLNVRTFYYISPQLWAWGQKRVKIIKKFIHKMIVLFPFEQTFYNKYGIDAAFVGHPLIDETESYNFMSRDDFYSKFSLNTEKEILVIMPGSREQEVKTLLPICTEAASLIEKDFNIQTIVACSPNLDKTFIDKFNNGTKATIIKGYTYELLKYSKFGIIKSGTSTLEAGLFLLPHIIIYKTSKITYWISKFLIKIKNIGLVNIVLQKPLITELIQDQVSREEIYSCCRDILGNSEKMEFYKSELANIKSQLGEPGAAERAARIIVNESKTAQ